MANPLFRMRLAPERRGFLGSGTPERARFRHISPVSRRLSNGSAEPCRPPAGRRRLSGAGGIG